MLILFYFVLARPLFYKMGSGAGGAGEMASKLEDEMPNKVAGVLIG